MPPKLIEKIISRKKRCDKKARTNYCDISPLAHTSAQTSARIARAVVFCLWLIPIQETRQSFSAVLYTISTVLTSQRLRLYIKMRVPLHSHSFLVGVARLELAALRSRTVRATKLRYTPIIYIRNQFLTAFAIYINFAIFATKTSQLSQKISFVSLFFCCDTKNLLQNNPL